MLNPKRLVLLYINIVRPSTKYASEEFLVKGWKGCSSYSKKVLIMFSLLCLNLVYIYFSLFILLLSTDGLKDWMVFSVTAAIAASAYGPLVKFIHYMFYNKGEPTNFRR